MRTDKRGFTMIELLVVLGIFGLAVVFVIPLMDHCHARGQTQLCKSQVKKISACLNLYQQDNNGCFPCAFVDDETHLMIAPPGRFLGDASYDRVGWWWQQFLCPYSDVQTFHQPTMFHCPSRQTDDKSIANPLWGNYGVNQSICKTIQDYPGRQHLTGQPLGPGQLKRPGQTLLLTDSGYNILNWSHVTTHPAYALSTRLEDTAYLPGLSTNRGKPVHESLIQDALQGRHENGCVNTGFCDGRVDTLTAESLRVDYRDDGTYTNLEVWNGGLPEAPAPLEKTQYTAR